LAISPLGRVKQALEPKEVKATKPQPKLEVEVVIIPRTRGVDLGRGVTTEVVMDMVGVTRVMGMLVTRDRKVEVAEVM
jgi:hypothetical protein